MSLRSVFLPVAGLLVVALAAPSFAKNVRSGSEPNWEAEPLYTTLDLKSGFDNDPRTVTVEAGGDTSADSLGPKCQGQINWDKPDVDINYEPNGEKLHIYVRSDVDTTLVVYTPDRKWVCGDDTTEANLNPAITFDEPAKGNYNIWIGTYKPGEAKPATLYISEMDPPR